MILCMMKLGGPNGVQFLYFFITGVKNYFPTYPTFRIYVMFCKDEREVVLISLSFICKYSL